MHALLSKEQHQVTSLRELTTYLGKVVWDHRSATPMEVLGLYPRISGLASVLLLVRTHSPFRRGISRLGWPGG